MARESSIVLSIAGFDPSGGAGVLGDIKTFEANKVQGMAVITANTFQNDQDFEGLNWIDESDILRQIERLGNRFTFEVIKIGLIKDLATLNTIVRHVKHLFPGVKLIWDPIIRASAGFEFHRSFEKKLLCEILDELFLITPNADEIRFLTGEANYTSASHTIGLHCNVLLKGGHNRDEPGVDYLFSQNTLEKIFPTEQKVFAKHGSGCVLSAAIAANLVLGNDLLLSCQKAKVYIEKYMSSHSSLLGFHYVQ